MKARDVKRFLVTLSFLAIAAAAAGGPSPAGTKSDLTRAEGGGVDSLVVLHTNDIHSHFDPLDEAGGRLRGGAAARAALLARERARGGRVLLLDAGDLVQGTPYYNRFHGEPEHRLLDLLGYDATTLGNHDLDDGPAAWRARASATRTPILSANVFGAAESAWVDPAGRAVPEIVRRSARWVGGTKVPPGSGLRYLAAPYVLLERGGLRIAVFGLTTDDLRQIVSISKNQGVAVGNPIVAARELVPRLRQEADLVIAVTHLGVDIDSALAQRVAGIDLIVGGHSHTALRRPALVPSPEGRVTPIVQAGAKGMYVGRTTLRWAGTGLRTATGTLLDVDPNQGEDPKVAALVASYRDRLGAELKDVVFRSRERVGNSDLRECDSPLGNFVADVIRDRTGADISIMNAGGIRAPLPKGEVTRADIMTMLPFENRLVVITMRGSQVRTLLDQITRRLGKGGFAHASGVSYILTGDYAGNISVGGTRGHRGEPLDGNRLYRVATIDYLAEGGDGFTIFADGSEIERTNVVLSDAAASYLLAHPDRKFEKDGRARWEASTRALRDLMRR